MKRLSAIVMLTLRAALRERVVWSMLALVVGTLLLLPLGLRGDGTLAGELRMHIRYSMGISAALLAGMTLWVSCGAIAGDLSSKRLQLLLSKPLSRATLWWGKWIAVSFLSVSLLLLCGAVTYLRVQQRVNDASVTAEERARLFAGPLSARQPVDPVPVDVSGRVEEMFQAQLQAGGIPANMSEADLERYRQELTHIATALRHSANQGERVVYEFRLPRPVAAGEALQLGYQFDGATMGVRNIPGTWRIGTAEHPEVHVLPVEQAPAGEVVFELPFDSRLEGARELRVEFENRSEEAHMVFFRSREGVRIYRPAGAFGPNLLRALLLIGGLLSLLAALGVSSGALFSLPVACYATAMMLVLQAFSGTLNEVLEQGSTLREGSEPGPLLHAVDRAALALYRGMHAVLQPLDVQSPLDRVSRGIEVSPAEVLRTLGLRMGGVLLLLSIAGIFLFGKREVGVAE